MEIDGLMILKLNKNQRLRSLIAIFSMPCRSISITRVNEKEPHDDFSFLFIGSSFLLGLFCLLFFFSISRSICLFVFLFPFVFFLNFLSREGGNAKEEKKKATLFPAGFIDTHVEYPNEEGKTKENPKANGKWSISSTAHGWSSCFPGRRRKPWARLLAASAPNFSTMQLQKKNEIQFK